MDTLYPRTGTPVNLPGVPGVPALPRPADAEPQPLPADLQPFWDCLASLSRRAGYCWAKVPWLMARWGVKRWKVYAILRKLARLGRLITQDVPGSHERRLYPVDMPDLPPPPPAPKRKSNEHQTKMRGTFRASEPATQGEHQTPPPAPAPDADAEVVASLREKGVSEPVARRLAAENPGECRRQIANPNLARARSAAAFLVAAIRGRWGWVPEGTAPEPGPPARRYVTAPRPETPARAPQRPAQAPPPRAAADSSPRPWNESLPPALRRRLESRVNHG